MRGLTSGASTPAMRMWIVFLTNSVLGHSVVGGELGGVQEVGWG